MSLYLCPYIYNADGKVATMTAKNSATGDQVTQYVYGTTLGNSDVASNELLRMQVYPKDTASSPDRLVLAYNRLGQLKSKLDQMGSVHTIEYDLLGRQLHDRVTTLGAGVDGAVRRISYGYEVRGMVKNITSHNNAAIDSGSVVNDVQNAYNDFGLLITQHQSHAGAVNPSTTPKTQMAYGDGSANTIRPTSLIYPNGRVLNYNYGPSGGISDLLSRIGSLIDNDRTTHLADYAYVGMDRIVAARSPQPGTELTYIKLAGEPNGDGGDQYTGWDRFSRLIDQRWIKTSTGMALERTQYGYDQAGNRLWRDNLVANVTSANQDEFYTYDGLYQLKRLQRGQLNTDKTGITETLTWEEDYTFDPSGNWNNYLTKVSGTTNLNQDRTHNKANEILAIDGSSSLIQQDAAGNISKTPQSGDWSKAYKLAYDAWNRPVKVMSGPSTVATYAYDGSSRRTTKIIEGETRHYYYTPQWQMMEERVGGSSSADRQFVWGLRQMDDLVLRDQGTQRMYAMHDYFNCTTIVDTTGTARERYGYNGFAQARFMTPTFGIQTGSSYGWENLFANYRSDSETGFYQGRHRYQHPSLGRWLTRDPLHEPGFGLRNWPNRDPLVEPGFELPANRFENGAKKKNMVYFEKGLAELLAVNPALAMRVQSRLAQLETSSNIKVDQTDSNLYMFVQNDPVDKIDPLGLDVWFWLCRVNCKYRSYFALLLGTTSMPVPDKVGYRCCKAAGNLFCEAMLIPLEPYACAVAAAEAYFEGCLWAIQ
jgi:YD repeat-containing protein